MIIFLPRCDNNLPIHRVDVSLLLRNMTDLTVITTNISIHEVDVIVCIRGLHLMMG